MSYLEEIGGRNRSATACTDFAGIRRAALIVITSSKDELPDSHAIKLRDTLSREFKVSLVLKHCPSKYLCKEIARLDAQGFKAAFIFGEDERARGDVLYKDLDARTDTRIKLAHQE